MMNNAYLPALQAALEAALASDDAMPVLRQAMEYALLGEGKRIRPRLLLMTAGILGCPQDAAMPFAVAAEMLHAYSLVHDDLPCVDDDDLRRGRATCHVKFGQAIAVFAGDALQARAFEILLQAATDENRRQAGQCLAAAIGPGGMVSGQCRDFLGEGKKLSESEFFLLHRQKTAALLQASVAAGGLLGGADQRQMKLLETYGEQLGMAFQAVDDLLDISADSATLGKTPGKDEQKQKQSYVAHFGHAGAIKRAASYTDAAIAAAIELGTAFIPLAELVKSLKDRSF